MAVESGIRPNPDKSERVAGEGMYRDYGAVAHGDFNETRLRRTACSGGERDRRAEGDPRRKKRGDESFLTGLFSANFH